MSRGEETIDSCECGSKAVINERSIPPLPP